MLSPQKIEQEIKRHMPEAESIRARLHGPAAIYCSATIDGRAHAVFCEPDVLQFYGGWNERSIAVYVAAKLAEALV
jgi:hypothetical protein